MKKLFSLIALAGVIAACTPEQVDTAFKLAGGKVTVNVEVVVQLVAMYAGWLWRKRDTGDGMPRNLRWMLNNRIFSSKMKTSEE